MKSANADRKGLGLNNYDEKTFTIISKEFKNEPAKPIRVWQVFVLLKGISLRL